MAQFRPWPAFPFLFPLLSVSAVAATVAKRVLSQFVQSCGGLCAGRLRDSVLTVYPDNPFTPALRSLASVVVLAAASSPVWADITVTVLGMANGGSKPVLVNKNIRVAVGPGRTERKILQLTTDAEGKVTIAGTRRRPATRVLLPSVEAIAEAKGLRKRSESQGLLPCTRIKEVAPIAFCCRFRRLPIIASVAHLDRALGFEPRGREFESLRTHQSYQGFPVNRREPFSFVRDTRQRFSSLDMVAVCPRPFEHYPSTFRTQCPARLVLDAVAGGAR